MFDLVNENAHFEGHRSIIVKAELLSTLPEIGTGAAIATPVK